MKLHATALAALSLVPVLPAAAQTGAFTDPANLRGERVQPKSGRELPIDGGQGNNALGLQQLLRKLNTRASLMLIVAHPDDEDGGMLTYYSRGLGARVATLTLTRGEGGQNAMTGDFGDALGLIRTQELLAADRYFGADQLFGTEVDFGFSKTKEEAFRKWTHKRVLYDAVRAVRLYRPLVLASVWTGGVTDGHGQHQVSGEIAQEVFKAAADPNVFPELTAEGILPWAPLKVYARVPGFAITNKGLFDYATNQYVPPSFTNYVTGVTTATPPTPDVVIHEGQPDPLLTDAAANPADLREKNPDPSAQLSYVQFARIGLGLQRTQIGPNFRLASPGVYDVGYHLYGSRLCNASNAVKVTEARPNLVISTEAKRSGETCVQPAAAAGQDPSADSQTAGFFDGIDTSLEGIASLAPNPGFFKNNDEWKTFKDAVHDAQATFDPKHPEATAPLLAKALRALDLLGNLPREENEEHELAIKRVQLNEALALALDLHLVASAPSPFVNLGEEIPVKVGLTSHANSELSASPLLLLHPDPNRSAAEPFACVPATSPQPFGSVLFERKPLPFTQECTAPSRLTNSATRPYFYRDNIEQPFYTLRTNSLRNAPSPPPALEAEVLVRYRDAQLSLDSVVEAEQRPVQIVPPVSLSLNSKAEVLPLDAHSLSIDVHTLIEDQPSGKLRFQAPADWVTRFPDRPLQTGTQTFFLSLPGHPLTTPVAVKAHAIVSGSNFSEGYRPVGYPGLVYTNFYTPATTRIVPVDLKLPTHRSIAYLPGTGDAVADNLRSIGLEVSNLTVADLTPEHLASFDTVILGVRTYNAHPDLHGAPTEALLDFARNGGNVIVQYQTAEFTTADAPYPLTLGTAEKVVDETTPVRLLQPNATALTYPNRINESDFNDWVEERGHGFLQSWDPHYTALTETHDPGAPSEHVAPQLPQEGGLVTTQLGRGHWTYLAFALYRQLPEAVPGAFRLFTNLVGLADQR